MRWWRRIFQRQSMLVLHPLGYAFRRCGFIVADASIEIDWIADLVCPDCICCRMNFPPSGLALIPGMQVKVAID